MEDKETLQASALVSLMRKRNIKEIRNTTHQKYWLTNSIRMGRLCFTYQFSDPVKNHINHFLPNSVVTTSIVISSIFFACHQLLWMKELSVCASSDLICKTKRFNCIARITLTYWSTAWDFATYFHQNDSQIWHLKNFFSNTKLLLLHHEE